MTAVFRLSTTSWKLVFSHLSRRHGKHAFTISSMGPDIPTGWALVHERVGPRCSGGVRLHLWPPAVVGAFTGLSARVAGGAGVGAGVGAGPATGPMRTTRLSPQSSPSCIALMHCRRRRPRRGWRLLQTRCILPRMVWWMRERCGAKRPGCGRSCTIEILLAVVHLGPPSDGRTAVTPLPRSIPHGFGGGFSQNSSRLGLGPCLDDLSALKRASGIPYCCPQPRTTPFSCSRHPRLKFFSPLFQCHATPLLSRLARRCEMATCYRGVAHRPVALSFAGSVPTAPNRLLAASCPSREQPAAHPVARACDPRLQIRHAFRLASHEAGEGACAASCVAVVVLNARSAGSVTPSKWP